MKTVNRTSRVLGIAFLLQFVTSISSGMVLQPAWLVPGNISESMLTIANKPWLMQMNILVDMLTALGIIFLGAMLFSTLRKQNEKIALVAFGFYIMEATLLAVSKISAFSLIHISQEYTTTGHPAYLLTMGNLALDSMNFGGSTLHMLTFCFGGILFYYLLFKSRIVPWALSLWGLLTVFPMLIATVSELFGTLLPIYFYILYIPFELVIGIWILVKGIKDSQEE